jgi:hypothetical protein
METKQFDLKSIEKDFVEKKKKKKKMDSEGQLVKMVFHLKLSNYSYFNTYYMSYK